MNKNKLRLTALVLALAMVLCGCSGITRYLERLASAAGYQGQIHYEDMEYSRPDMDECERVLSDACDAAENAKKLDDVLSGIYGYYDVYDRFSTNYCLSYIRYCGDVTDAYWQEEYAFCAENLATVEAGLEELYHALAASSWRDKLEEDYFGADFFDAYEGENVWDEGFVKLMEEEAALENDYYGLYQESLSTEYYSEEFFSVYGSQMAQVLVELVAKRQEIAAYAGYDSYPQFAYDFYYYRDYTPEQAEEYLMTVGKEMVELYCSLDQEALWSPRGEYCDPAETFAYVKSTAHAMGGDIENAFGVLEEKALYDIAYGENKMDISFEMYLSAYNAPFVFVAPYGDAYDKLTFAHEFGHFVNDYVCGGSYAGTDIAEVHSQGMEYLSLCYPKADDALVKMKMADCLGTYVEQAAFALFEHRLYSLTGDELTAENIHALYSQIGSDFGFNSWAWDSRDFVTLEHFFSEPMYLVSYVLSNDVAFGLYQMELESPGAGLEVYEQCLLSQDSYIVTFAEQYGFEDPFAEGRLAHVRQTLEELLR